MTRQIEKAMEADIKTLDWMSEKTKARALEKLASVVYKIGYPDKWRDYSKLEIVRGDALGNMERASGFELRRQLAKIGKPVDRREWTMTPPTNDAYYDPQLNDVNLPAGVLQPPNFDMKADDAANYGNLVALIGHELTHGFDDEGRHYDAHGNLQDWWTEEDAKAFEARASGLVGQYGAFVAVKDPSDPAKDVHVDGKLTLGENTADNGGIRLSYEAFLTTPGAKAGKDFTRLHARPALLSQLRAGLVREPHRRVRQGGRQDRPALPRQVSCQRRCGEHACVPRGLRVQGRDANGSGRGSTAFGRRVSAPSRGSARPMTCSRGGFKPCPLIAKHQTLNATATWSALCQQQTWTLRIHSRAAVRGLRDLDLSSFVPVNIAVLYPAYNARICDL